MVVLQGQHLEAMDGLKGTAADARNVVAVQGKRGQLGTLGQPAQVRVLDGCPEGGKFIKIIFSEIMKNSKKSEGC